MNGADPKPFDPIDLALRLGFTFGVLTGAGALTALVALWRLLG